MDYRKLIKEEIAKLYTAKGVKVNPKLDSDLGEEIVASICKRAVKNCRIANVSVSLPIESFDVDDWLGLTHGVWYHPFIELYNYNNGDKKSIELSQIIADYANSVIQQ